MKKVMKLCNKRAAIINSTFVGGFSYQYESRKLGTASTVC